ncbi:MAG: hypothetical protein LBT09_11060 [Planctomycetaceae bacterium]|nr:hypothetical protein [Planctomycetaceae bacterium]
MHESTRKLILVLIFFVTGPLLTLLITGAIILRKLPSNVDNYERAAVLSTGLRWEIGSVEYRKSNQIRFRNVRLFHTNSIKPLFAASEIDLTYISGSIGKTGTTKSDRHRLFPGVINSQNQNQNQTKNHDKTSDKNNTGKIFGSIKRFWGVGDRGEGFWHLSVSRSLVDLGGVDGVGVGVEVDGEVALRECFLELASRLETLSGEPVLIMFDEVDVTATSLKRFKVRFVAGNLYQTESAIRSEWSFLIPIVSETERERVSIIRRRNSRNLSVTLTTGNMPLPCELVAIFCPPFRFLGQYPARVCGEITAEVERIGGSGGGAVWVYSLRNVFFNDINISQIAAGNIPYNLNGNIKGLRVNEALLGGGKLLANGWIEVVDGVIERGLFHRLVKQFALTVKPESLLDAPRAEYPFTRCILNYKLQNDGIIFWAERSNENIDNIFMFNVGDGVQTLPMAVSLPNGGGKLVSYHNVLSVFAPDSAPIIPLTPFSKYFVPLIPTNEQNTKTQNTDF